MWNPFKRHEEEHDDVALLLFQLTFELNRLADAVKELREEVDYLVDYLDD